MNSCVDCNTGAYVLFSSLALEKHFLACSFFLLYFILSHALDLCVCVYAVILDTIRIKPFIPNSLKVNFNS